MGKQKLDTKKAWEIWLALPECDRTFTNVAKALADEGCLVRSSTISIAFVRAGLMESRKSVGKPRSGKPAMSNAERQRRYKSRRKELQQRSLLNVE